MEEDYLTPTFLFKGDDIDKIHREVTKTIVKDGKDFTFGYENKDARETAMFIQVYGKAIKRLMNGGAPKEFVFNGDKLKEFRRQGVCDDPNPFGHVYTYPQMLREYPDGDFFIDQLEQIKVKLKGCVRDDNFDNGLVGVLYHPTMAFWGEKPCWNWVQVRYLGDNKVSLRLLFRSHDYNGGLWANLSFILYMMRHFVTRECGCEIVEVLLVSMSAHIYEGDRDIAESTARIPWLRDTRSTVRRIRDYMGELCQNLR